MTTDLGAKRPRTVVLAAVIQLLTAVPFLLGTFVVLAYGPGAQAAAEAEVARQGLPPSVLDRHGVSFGDNAAELPFAIGIVLALVALALLNLNGKRLGRVLSWIGQPILFVAGAVIVPGQVFLTPLLASAFSSSGDPDLARVDVPALVDAASRAMPGWLPAANLGKLALTTLGSALVVVLLALPSARAWFRSR